MSESLDLLTIPDLNRMLMEAVQDSIGCIVRAASIYGELRKRGDAVESVTGGLRRILESLSQNRLTPAMATALFGKTSLVPKFERLPHPEQERIAQNGYVDVVVGVVDGQPDSQRVQLELLMPWQADLVVDCDRVRTKEEQAAKLRSRSAGLPIGGLAEKPEVGPYIISKKGLIGRRGFLIPWAELKRLVRDHIKAEQTTNPRKVKP